MEMTITINIPYIDEIMVEKRKIWRMLEWPRQSPDLNPLLMQKGDLKRVVHARNSSNITQLQEKILTGGVGKILSSQKSFFY